ncbi:MAG: DNA-directed RNA polymerase subunit omega [Clostridia bacterium]|nr:DNA-directed RNA polymerase subunit omega [Clostridia bacterium]
MIYPPVNDLVKKIGKNGNRYNLVIATAKRTRQIAEAEKKQNKEKPAELSVLEMRIKERMEKKNDKKVVKPIIKALDELINDDLIIIDTDGYKTDNYSAGSIAMPSEKDIIIEDDGE